jgi:hypothetical protein
MGGTVKVETSANAQLVRKHTRLGWQVAIIAGVSALILCFTAYERGDVFGLRLNTAWRLPFTLGLAGMLIYLIVSALRTGRVLTRGGVIERSAKPGRFLLHLTFLALMAVVLVVATAALVYVDLVGLRRV